jgi:hypothetical protein
MPSIDRPSDDNWLFRLDTVLVTRCNVEREKGAEEGELTTCRQV